MIVKINCCSSLLSNTGYIDVHSDLYVLTQAQQMESLSMESLLPVLGIAVLNSTPQSPYHSTSKIWIIINRKIIINAPPYPNHLPPSMENLWIEKNTIYLNKPVIYPAELFRIVDNKTSIFWQYNMDEYKNIYFFPNEFLKPNFISEIWQEESESLKIYLKLLNAFEIESF